MGGDTTVTHRDGRTPGGGGGRDTGGIGDPAVAGVVEDGLGWKFKEGLNEGSGAAVTKLGLQRFRN